MSGDENPYQSPNSAPSNAPSGVSLPRLAAGLAAGCSLLSWAVMLAVVYRVLPSTLQHQGPATSAIVLAVLGGVGGVVVLLRWRRLTSTGRVLAMIGLASGALACLLLWAPSH